MLESLIFSVALSTHVGFDGEFNNVHPRLTYQQKDYITGIYYNSESQPSVFLGKEFVSGSLSIEAGIVSGYSEYPVAPMVKFNYANFFIAPASSNGDAGIVTGIEVKF